MKQTTPRSRRPSIAVSAGIVALCHVVGLAHTAPSWAADPSDPDWPCIQRMVPEISSGMVWAGPPLDGIGNAWQEDAEVVELARQLAARRMPLDDAAASITRFADALDSAKERRLTLLFAAVFDTINADRSSIMNGIRRYARRQRALADKIEARAAELAGIPSDGSEQDSQRRDALQEQQVWDTRIYDEREQSLVYVCETPVLLEQRLFRIGREIMAHLN